MGDLAIDTGVLKLKSCQGGFVYPMKLYYPHDIPVLCRYTHHLPQKRAIAVVSLLASPPSPDRCAPPGTEQEQGMNYLFWGSEGGVHGVFSMSPGY